MPNKSLCIYKLNLLYVSIFLHIRQRVLFNLKTDTHFKLPELPVAIDWDINPIGYDKL